jgi:hypothetical protein
MMDEERAFGVEPACRHCGKLIQPCPCGRNTCSGWRHCGMGGMAAHWCNSDARAEP